jgi:hypothetical protein
MDLEEWDRMGFGEPKESEPRDKDPGTGKPVANLLVDYQTKRTAWLAEVDQLAQLRDQVRNAAERETLEILARARQDARKLIASARRELLVLSEQVRVALGDSEPTLAAELRRDTARQIHSLDTTPAGVLFAEASTPALPAAVVPEANQSRETVQRNDHWGDLDSLLSETESLQR